jgi:hypothetical protein
MYFCVYEHYDENQPNYYDKKEIIECLVCLETKNAGELEPIKLQEQSLYFTKCKCDSYVHKKCLKLWVDKYKICPICRTNIIDKNFILIISKNYIPYGNYIYIFIVSIDVNVFKVLSVFFFVCILLDIYLINERYIISKYGINSNNSYNNSYNNNYNNYNNYYNNNYNNISYHKT